LTDFQAGVAWAVLALVLVVIAQVWACITGR